MLNIFNAFSDMRVFDFAEFPKFTKYYIKDTNVINNIEKALVWSHISPSGKIIEWFTNNNDTLFELFKTIQDKSQKTGDNKFKFTDELSEVDFSDDAQFFLFYKKNETYKARLVLVYYYTPEIIHVVFDIEDIDINDIIDSVSKEN